MLVDLVAAGTIVAGDCLGGLDRVNDVTDVRALGDAVNVGTGSPTIVGPLSQPAYASAID